MRLQVSRFGANAWDWVPAGLRTVSNTKIRGCNCHGTGSMGTLINDGKGFTLSKEIPCVCLHVEITEAEMPKIMSQVAEHFKDNAEKGAVCHCMFCVERRNRVC